MEGRSNALMVIALTLGVCCLSRATVHFGVYLPEPNTPLTWADPNVPDVYQDVMVGTEMSLVIRSDSAGILALLSLSVTRPFLEYGSLSARGFSDLTLDWEGSRLPASGSRARVWELVEGDGDGPTSLGFQFFTEEDSVPGDWFIFDYKAQRVGRCEVELFDYFGYSPLEPVQKGIFQQVSTRDFDCDSIVDFNDFAILARNWRTAHLNAPGDPNAFHPCDLDSDSDADVNDLMLFVDYWLVRTRKQAVDPNAQGPADPE